MPPRTPSSRAWRSRPTAPCGCSTSPTRMSCRTRSCRAAGWCASRPGLPTPSTPAPASWDWATPPIVRAAFGSPVALERLAAAGGLEDLRVHRSVVRRIREDGPGHALLAARALEDEVRRRTAALKAAGKAELAELTQLYSGELPRGVAKQIEERTSRREREAKTLVLQAALDDLVGWLRDCLLVGAGGDAHILPIVHVDAVMELREEAEALSAAVLLAAIDRVLDTRLALESNVGTTLALEAMLLDLSTLVMVGVSG